MRLAVALTWHSLPFESLLDLARRAEALGYAALFVDGDVSVVPSRGERDVLDGVVVQTELLARTERIEVVSIRLVHHWNAGRLAQTLASLARLHPGRVRLFVSIGGRPEDRRFGLPLPPHAERVAWLDETLDAVRALWRGETVTRRGRRVTLEDARVRPVPAPPIPVHVACGGSERLLEVVARHADAWDVNLPPVPRRVARAEARLARACQALGREADPTRSLFVFARPGREPGDPALLAEFRRLNPWFSRIPDAEVLPALVVCPPGEAWGRIERLAAELGIDLPVADLSGLDADAARDALEALAPSKNSR